MVKLESVRISEVTKLNFEQLWPQIIKDVAHSSFIAIDAEMSGLGTTKNTMKSNLDERYTAISSYASTRSIISIGLACFAGTNNSQHLEENENKAADNQRNAIEFSVSVYNIVLLCSDPYTIDPGAVEFLVNHGFNFNKQFSEGIPYYKGNDRSDDRLSQHNMRNLFSEIIRRRKPLVLHNGLTDLIFMYQCFYAQCPQKLTALMADVSEIFPSGIYDTKYIAEFLDHTPASFLLYLFKYSLVKNEELSEAEKVSLAIRFENKGTEMTLAPLNENKNLSTANVVCEKYAAYGWCVQGTRCKKSHDINAIINMHKSKTSKKRKRKPQLSNERPVKILCSSDDRESFDQATPGIDTNIANHVNNSSTVEIKCSDSNECNNVNIVHKNTLEDKSTEIESVRHLGDVGDAITLASDATSQRNSNKVLLKADSASSCDGHRSGIDAFMTGYAFALFIVSRNKDCQKVTGEKIDLEKYCDSIPYLSAETKKLIVNKLYLSGKSIPLPVCKSSFTKTSKNHNDKILKLYLK